MTDYQGADSVYTLGDMTYLTYPSEEQAENALNIYKENGYTAEKDVITEFNLEELDEENEKIISESTTSENGNVHTNSELESLNYNPITVAVLDSGINPDDEIKGRIVFKQRIYYEDRDSEISTTWLPYEWGGQSRQFEDSYNHGTQIAKIIAENTNANVQIASYNVIDDNNKIYTSALVSAIYDCIAKDVKVINMSLTTRGYSEILEYAIKDAMEHGIIVVAAAGNYGEDASGYTPANISGVITVGASDENGNIADYSNYGEDVDCIADGRVYSEEGEVILKGTSFSAARVSAYTARILYGRSAGYVKYILDYIKEQTGNNITYENITKALNNVGLLEKINDKLTAKDYENMINSISYKQMMQNKFEKEMTFSLQGLRGASEHWGGPYVEGHGQQRSERYVMHASDPGFRYGYTYDAQNSNAGAWEWNSAYGKTVKDRNSNNHTVCHNAWIHTTDGRDANDSTVCSLTDGHDDGDVNWSNLWHGGFFRACEVGITYQIGVGNPGNPNGYTFAGWSVTGGSAYTSEDSGYKYAHVGVYEDDVDFYETWNCNHSYWGRNENYTGYGECGGSCGYYTCKNCSAYLGDWDTRYGHSWLGAWYADDNYHWHICNNNNSHIGYKTAHTKEDKYDGEDDNYIYKHYECTVCHKKWAYTIKKYTLTVNIYNQNPDGSWTSPWTWLTRHLTAGAYWHFDGYGGDSTGPDNPVNGNVCTSGYMPSSDKIVNLYSYRQTRTVDINTRFSSDGSDNYATYNSGLNGITYAVWTNGNYEHNYDTSHKVLDWCYGGIRVGATFDISVFTEPGYHTEYIGQYELDQGLHQTFTNSNKYSQRYSIEATLPETYKNKGFEVFVKPNLYHYKFNLNIPLKATQPETARYNTPNETNTYVVYYNNSIKTSAVANRAMPTPSLHGWEFVGWNTKSDGSGKWYDSDTVYNQTSDLNLYAIWSQTQYTVKLSANVGSTGHTLGENLSDKLDSATQQKISLNTYQDGNNNLTLGNITWKYHPDGNDSYYEAVFTYDEPQSIYDYDAYFHLSYFIGNGWYYNGNKISGISSYSNSNIKFNLIDLVNGGSNYLAGPSKNVITLKPSYKINNSYVIDTRNQEGNLEKIDYYRRFYTGQTVTYDMLMLMNPNKKQSGDNTRLVKSFTTLSLSDLSSYPITKTESAKTSGNDGNTSKVNPISITDDFSTSYMRDNLEIEKLIFKDINGNSISSISGTDLRNKSKSGIKVPDNARSYEVIFRATDDGWVEVDSTWNSKSSLGDVKKANGGYTPNNGNSSKVYKHTESRTVRASYTGAILQNNAPTLKETPVRIYKEQIESWTTLNDTNKEIEELKTTILKYQVVSDFEDNNDKLSNWFKSEIQSQILRNSMSITDIHKGTRRDDGSMDYSSGNSIELKDIIKNIHDIKDNQYYEVTITIKDSFDKETKSKVHLYIIYNPADFDVNESNNIDRVVYMPTNITGNYTLSDSIISHNLQGTSKEGLLNSSYSKVDGTPVETEEYKFNSGSIYSGSGSVKIIEY